MLSIAPFLTALMIDATGLAPVQSVALAGGVTVVEDGRVDPPAYTVLVDGKRVGGWLGESWDASHRLQAHKHGDLVLVASRVSQSNGMGVESWRFAAVKLRFTGPIDPPVRWSSADWGPDGLRNDGKTLDVLATDWLEPDSRGSLRFAGAWFRIDNGRLHAVSPWKRRPYRFSFERERTRYADQPGYWLRASKARVLPAHDPWRSTGDLRLARTIQKVVWGTAGAVVTFEGLAPTRIATVADGKTLWPVDYRPADSGRSWVGRRGVVNGLGARRVLTLAP